MQGVLEQAVRRVIRHQVVIIGSGRTDAGVHAAGQVANFVTECAIPAGRLRKAIGSRIPKDMSVADAADVSRAFDARRAASSKLYCYRIHNSRERPVGRLAQRQTYHFWNPLDVEGMREGAAHFIGTRDFSAMASKGSERETTVRGVLRCEVERWYDEVRVSVEGFSLVFS